MTKTELLSENEYLKEQIRQLRENERYIREVQEPRDKAERISRILLQERRSLVARINQIDMLMELAGGVPNGGSPEVLTRR